MTTFENATPPQPQADTTKPISKWRQGVIGLIVGLLALAFPLWPVVALLNAILPDQQVGLPSLIISVLVSFIIFLLTRRRWRLFSWAYLITSVLILILLSYLLFFFSFT